MRTRRMLCGMGLVMALGMGAGCAHDEAKYARNQGEKVGQAFAEKVRFADQLAFLDQEQIALGQLAVERSSNPEVRRFAQLLIRDHENHLSDLRALADAQAFSLALVDLSTQDTATGGAGWEGAEKGADKGEKAYDKKTDKQVRKFIERRDELASRGGADFDRAFLDQVNEDQERGKELVEEGLDEYRGDTSLALLLGRTAPVLQSHQRQIDTLQGFIGH
jgi:predicted outer membrane protein